jgi:Flp pilus assembly protein TadG
VKKTPAERFFICTYLRNHLHAERRGVAAILIVAMLFVFIVTAALTVDIAYMQLIRTELRACTDAAAKAGAEALARTEDPTKQS